MRTWSPTRYVTLNTIIIISLAICLVLTLYYATPPEEKIPKHMFRGAIDVPAPRRCSPERREALINAPLPISVHANVNTTQLESSGCFEINTDRPGIWRILDDTNFVNTVCGPIEKHFLEPKEKDTHTALASLAGSGNTWIRHLLEEVTGIHTGSIYGSKRIDQVFKGKHTTHNVIAIKTHGGIDKQYDKAIVIVRDPFDSYRAEFNRRSTKNKNKTGTVSQSTFHANGFKRGLQKRLDSNGVVTKINNFPGPLFVLFYEKLQSDLMNSLTKLVAFCEAKVTLKRLYCTLQNNEGSFHRGEKPEWMSRKRLIDESIEGMISSWKKAIGLAIENRKLDCPTN